MWDGISIPKAKFRLRWAIKDAQGNTLSYSAWTPNSEGSYSKADKPEGSIVHIEAECSSPYEEKSVICSRTCDIDSIEYLVLLINGKLNHVGMGFVKDNLKKWALSNGDIYEETVR